MQLHGETGQIPTFESLAAHAAKTSKAGNGQRNAWEIFTGGIVNLQKANYEGWNNGPPSPLYSNAVATGSAAAPSAAVPASRPASSIGGAPAAAAPPRMGAKELAKAAARAAAADEAPKAKPTAQGSRRAASTRKAI